MNHQGRTWNDEWKSFDENGDPINTNVDVKINNLSWNFATQPDGKIHVDIIEYFDTAPDTTLIEHNDPNYSGFVFLRKPTQQWNEKNYAENEYNLQHELQPAKYALEHTNLPGEKQFYAMKKYHESDLGVTYEFPGDTLYTFFGRNGQAMELWKGEYINSIIQGWMEGDTTNQIPQNKIDEMIQVEQNLAAASTLNNGEVLRKHTFNVVYSPTNPAWSLSNKSIVKRWPQGFLANAVTLNGAGNIIESTVFSGINEPVSYGMFEEHFEARTGTDEIQPYNTAEAFASLGTPRQSKFCRYKCFKVHEFKHR